MKYSWNGQPLEDPICIFLLTTLVFWVLVLLSPIWIPVHVVLRALGRKGFFYPVEQDDNTVGYYFITPESFRLK